MPSIFDRRFNQKDVMLIYIMNEQLVLIPNLEYKFTSSRETMKNFYPRYEQYTIYKVKNA